MKNLFLFLISFFAVSLTAQNLDHLKRDRAVLAQEQVFLDTDKNFYLTGETIWYKAYCINALQRTPSTLSAVLYVELLDTKGMAILQEKVLLENGQGRGHLFISSEMKSGDYVLRAYTAWMKNFDPQLFFNQTITFLNPFSSPGSEISLATSPLTDSLNAAANRLAIDLPQTTYSNREKIQVNISIPADLTDSDPANLSVSVYKYSEDADPRGATTQTLIPPQSAPGGSSSGFDIQYLPEIHSPLIQGTIRPLGAIPVPPYFYILFPGKSSYLYTVEPKNNHFVIEISPEIRTTDMLFWAENTDINQFEITILPSFLSGTQVAPPQKIPIGETNRAYLESLSTNTQVANAYLPFTHIRGIDTPKNQPESAFYGTGDIIYNLDEYTRFPTMEEVFTEYVRFVIARKRKENDKVQQFYLWDLYANNISISNSIFFTEPALTMIDGVPVGDLETIWNFDPRKIQRIEMVNRKYHSGGKIFHGIIYFHTYKGDLAGEKIPKDILQQEYNPIQEPRIFYSPDYEQPSQEDSRIPDYRTLLYWNPQISVNAKGEAVFSFFTGDDSGHYRIEVNGILPDGTPVYGNSDFEVISGRRN